MFKRLFLVFSLLMLGTFGLQAQSTTTTESESQTGTTQSSPSMQNDQTDRNEFGTDTSDESRQTTTTESESRTYSEEQGRADQSDQQLPRTASNMPLMGLFGLALLAAAFMMRSIRAIKGNR